MLQCELCDGWVHAQCDGISPIKYEAMAHRDELYHCRVCRGKPRWLARVAAILKVCFAKKKVLFKIGFVSFFISFEIVFYILVESFVGSIVERRRCGATRRRSRRSSALAVRRRRCKRRRRRRNNERERAPGLFACLFVCLFVCFLKRDDGSEFMFFLCVQSNSESTSLVQLDANMEDDAPLEPPTAEEFNSGMQIQNYLFVP